MKRRVEGDQGGSAAKRPRRTEGWSEGSSLEECKVCTLERIAKQLEWVGDRLEQMEGEARLGNDLAAVTYLRDTVFESVDWAHWDWLAEIATWSWELDLEKWWREEQDKGEGSSKRV